MLFEGRGGLWPEMAAPADTGVVIPEGRAGCWSIFRAEIGVWVLDALGSHRGTTGTRVCVSHRRRDVNEGRFVVLVADTSDTL